MTSTSPDEPARPTPPSWEVRHRAGLPGELHAGLPASAAARQVWVTEPTSAAVVLGSGQMAPETATEPVIRRRSGGGAVHVAPGAQVWVDVSIGSADPLWEDDVARAFLWLGHVWAAALASCAIDARVHEGAYEPGEHGSELCFAGRGPGEVFIGARKVVGISQRRSGRRAWFQAMAPRQPQPAALVDAAVRDPARRRAARAALADGTAPAPVAPEVLVDTFLLCLDGAVSGGGGVVR